MCAALTLDGDCLTVGSNDYDLSEFERVMVIGAGKASASMARALENILEDRLQSGTVVTKYGHGLDVKKIEVMESAHPVPDMAG